MDTEREEMCEHHPQPEDEATISSILGAVFPAEKEAETTGTMSSAKLDEEVHGPKVPCCCRLHTHWYRASRT